MTILQMVQKDGPLHRGMKSEDVKALQAALYAAGHRVGVDGDFGPRTEMVVEAFQRQFHLPPSGVVDAGLAEFLDTAAHSDLVDAASPRVNDLTGLPHDDTASLLAYYGDPRNDLDAWKTENVITVPCPWTLLYEGKKWPHPIQFHRKVAPKFAAALEAIWACAGRNDDSPLLTHVRNFSGSGNFRPVRESSRLSCHAFWCAIDFDAERLPRDHRVPATEMPAEIVEEFKSTLAFWGGDFVGRPDPMHFQYAHE